MELSGRRYPIGIQNFEQLRTRNCVYVDKTELVYKLVNTDQIYFFSRPRRFGKSLLVSTLEAYFQGKKELFEGLAMERLEQEWEVCPVLHVDFSLTKYTELRDLTGQLNLFLSRWEEIYGKKEEEEGAAERLQGIILRAYAKTGKPVVVLTSTMLLCLTVIPMPFCNNSFATRCASSSVLSRGWGNISVFFLSRVSASSAS